MSAVAASDFASVVGSDETVTIVNRPPVVSIGQLGPVIHLRDLGRPPILSLPLDVDEPAWNGRVVLRGVDELPVRW